MGTLTRALRAHRVVAGPAVERLEPRELLAFTALVNFQPPNRPTPSGYRADTGAVFGNRGGGLSYGWNATNNNAIDRNSSLSPDQRYDTFAQMQIGGNFSWEIAVPNGSYDVKITSGDPVSNNAFYHVFAEGRQMINGAPSNNQRWIGSNFVVNVTDGRLTVTNGASAVNNKINFIEVRKATPAAASNTTAAALSSSQVQVNWRDNSNNEDGFTVQRALGQSNVWTNVGTVGANVTTFTDGGLTPSTEYRYRVQSFNDVGPSWSTSNAATVMTQAVPGATPAAPSNLAATGATPWAVTLTWTDNSDNEEKFVVEHFTYQWNVVKEVGANVTTASTYVRSGQVNQFRVRARNSTGGTSEASNIAFVSVRPEAPVYVNAQAASSSAIDISWDSIDSCQFHVQKFVDGKWVFIARDLLALSFRDSGLPAGTAQSYRVIAVGDTGESDPSDVVTATTAPAAVTGLSSTGVTSTSVALRWDDVTGEAGYLVERSTDGVNWTTVTLTFADVTSFNVTGLQSRTTYSFRVTGFTWGVILGERSDPITLTTL